MLRPSTQPALTQAPQPPSPVSNGSLLFMGGEDGSYYLLSAAALGGNASTPLGFIPTGPHHAGWHRRPVQVSANQPKARTTPAT